MSIKLDIFTLKCKIAKIKLLLKKIIKTKVKNYSPIPRLPLISELKKMESEMEKNNDQTQDVFIEMNHYTVINQTLEQIIPQILASLR